MTLDVFIFHFLVEWNETRSHLTKHYNCDVGPGMGIRMVPMLKLEHFSLTSFSKMLAKIAAYICTPPCEFVYGFILPEHVFVIQV